MEMFDKLRLERRRRRDVRNLCLLEGASELKAEGKSCLNLLRTLQVAFND